MSNYTSLAELLNPEDLKQLMDLILGGAASVIKEYGGQVVRVVGDEIMAIFGLSRIQDDDAVRAVQAAYKIHRSNAEIRKHYRNKAGVSLQMHSGISSGMIVVGNCEVQNGVDGFSGFDINIASRLAEKAGPGEILVEHDTYQLAKADFEFKEIGNQIIQGSSISISVYRVVRPFMSLPESGLWIHQKKTAVLIGRGKELSQAEYLLNKSGTDHGIFMEVIGEPGVGKTAFVYELLKNPFFNDCQILEGRASSVGQNWNYHLFSSCLSSAAGIIGSDSQEIGRQKIEKFVMPYIMPEHADVFPHILRLMGFEQSATDTTHTIYNQEGIQDSLIIRSMKVLFAQISNLRPLVIILENLQWADPSSLNLMNRLFSLCIEVPVFFIVTRRLDLSGSTEHVDAFIPPSSSDMYARIRLHPLDENECETLLESIAPVIARKTALKVMIIEKSGGNPLCLHEIVRDNTDKGLLLSGKCEVEKVDNFDHITAPLVFKQIIASRLDRLQEQDHATISVAAVLGITFHDIILKDVCDDRTNVKQSLLRLEKQGLIERALGGDSGNYSFSNVLIQEIAYEMILPSQRKLLHIAVARSMEKNYLDRIHHFYGQIAYHFSRGGDIKLSEHYMHLSGKMALNVSSPVEALKYFQEALKYYRASGSPDPDQTRMIELKKDIAVSFFNKGMYSESLRYLDEVLEYYGIRISGTFLNKRMAAYVFFLKVFFLTLIPNWQGRKSPNDREKEILWLYSLKIISLSMSTPHANIGESLHLLNLLFRYNLRNWQQSLTIFAVPIRAFLWHGRFFSYCRKLLTFIEKLSVESKSECSLVNTINLYCFFAGRWQDFQTYNETVVQNALHQGKIMDAANYLIYNGLLFAEKGRYYDAVKVIDQLSGISKEFEHDLVRLYEIELRATLLVKWRYFEKAQKIIADGLSFAKKMNANAYLNYLYTLEAKIHLLKNDVAVAENSLNNAERFIADVEAAPSYYVPFLIVKSMLQAALYEQGVHRYRNISKQKMREDIMANIKLLARRTRFVAGEQTEAARIIGSSYWCMGRTRKAIWWWKKSVATGQRLAANIELALTFHEIGARLAETKSNDRIIGDLLPENCTAIADKMFNDMKISVAHTD
jgi:class 3 adenylate cyclase/tetratricopeptide (TPR) repeat protein